MISPNAVELCDLVDNDCDGTIDSSLTPVIGGGCPMGTSCKDILDAGLSEGDDCDMTTDDGGWTLLAKTVKSGLSSAERSTIWTGDWRTYGRDGYGDNNGGFWYDNCYETSMLHADTSAYSWAEDTVTSVSYLYFYFRED